MRPSLRNFTSHEAAARPLAQRWLRDRTCQRLAVAELYRREPWIVHRGMAPCRLTAALLDRRGCRRFAQRAAIAFMGAVHFDGDCGRLKRRRGLIGKHQAERPIEKAKRKRSAENGADEQRRFHCYSPAETVCPCRPVPRPAKQR